MDSTSSGDTVLVAPGTYVCTPYNDVDMPSGVTLISEEGPDETVIEICGTTTAVGVYGSEGVRVSGFTIRRSCGLESTLPMSITYGIRCYDCTDVIVENCVIEGMSYGIYFEGTSQGWWWPVFRNNQIRECGVGVGCWEVEGYSRPRFQDNVIHDCSYGAELSDAGPVFDGNRITYCYHGMHYEGHCGGNCILNVIAHNEECGVYVLSDPPLAAPGFNGSWDPDEANDIYDNGTWDIWYAHSGAYDVLMAVWNYWGCECPDFASRIYGRVDYNPWTDSTHTVKLNEDNCSGATEPTSWGRIKAMYR
jgi:hypothetical protein